MKILVICPHLAPDTAPTGTIMSRIIVELAERGHEVHVVTALPWYRRHQIEPEWAGAVWRTERTDWGSVTRVHPFPGNDKSNVLRRAVGFVGFTMLAGLAALRAGGWFTRCDVVFAMSPPPTLGPLGWLIARIRRSRLIFNIQDVFPDAAITTGAITSPLLIRFSRWFERRSYAGADAVTVLSDDLAKNVAAKMSPDRRNRVHVIPNFVDTERIVPGERTTAYRAELGLTDEPVVLYAGNVGVSQSLDLFVHAAKAMPHVQFVVNGEGSGLERLLASASDLDNFHQVGYQPIERLSEVLASGDVHVVLLKTGLGDVSVPSKAYSSLAAARPVVASVDLNSEIPRLLTASGAGVAVAPDDPDAFVNALGQMLNDAEAQRRCGEAGRTWVLAEASPAAVGDAYDRLVRSLMTRKRSSHATAHSSR